MSLEYTNQKSSKIDGKFFKETLWKCRAVGTGWAQGHLPTQYFKLLVCTCAHQFDSHNLDLIKWVPIQYLKPSYDPEMYSIFLIDLKLSKSKNSMICFYSCLNVMSYENVTQYTYNEKKSFVIIRKLMLHKGVCKMRIESTEFFENKNLWRWLFW